MSDSQPSNETPGSDASSVSPELRARFERLRSLRSAWGGLAPSGLSADKQAIRETGRELSERLQELACDGEQTDANALAAVDARMNELETEMRSIALRVPTAQLRSTLPKRIGSDRLGVLDLLDLMLGAEIEELAGTDSRIASIDYLITLLCTAGSADGVPLQDPVTLTARLYGLCEQRNLDGDPDVPEIEAEFMAAADVHRADALEEIALRRLRQRKVELASRYFSPRILRAIVAYNAAMLQRVDQEVSESQDWGVLSPASEQAAELAPEGDASLFDSPALRDLAAALRRRAAGEPASVSEVDRIAWCLDLSHPDASEKEALLAESVGLREDPKGTTILVGLLARSAVILEDELQAIGISDAQLSDAWVKELDEALKQEVNRLITSDEYKDACLVSELKTKYLYASRAEVRPRVRLVQLRMPTADTPGSSENPNATGETAAELTRKALEKERADAGRAARIDWKQMPWVRLATALAGLVVVGAAAVALFLWVAPDAGLDRMSRSELSQVSPYLAKGSRGENAGAVFVGTVGESWFGLGSDARLEAAADMVAVLHAKGFSQVMIYDEKRTLRIQALGTGAVQVVGP